MVDSAITLAHELKVLRRGSGLRDPHADRIGPLLRNACGIKESDNEASAQQKLRHWLTELTELLPDDMRCAVQAALGMRWGFDGDSLAERVQLLAQQQQRDIRTIRRRLDAGFDKLAEIASSRVEIQTRRAKPWRLERFETILMMDQMSPVAFERRTIIADRDGLDEVSTSMTVPPVDDGLQVDGDLALEVHFGARLISVERPSPTRSVFRLGLPRALQLGETHEFGLIMRLPVGQPMRPHYVLFPGMCCDEFDLRVRFGGNPPADVCRVSDISYRDLDAESSSGTFVPLDIVGEVRMIFRNLVPGCGYGVCWRYGHS